MLSTSIHPLWTSTATTSWPPSIMAWRICVTLARSSPSARAAARPAWTERSAAAPAAENIAMPMNSPCASSGATSGPIRRTRLPGAIRVGEGAVHDYRHVRSRLEQLHEDGGLEDDVAVEENERPAQLRLGAEEGVDLPRLREPVVVDEPEPRARHALLPVAAHHHHVAHAAVPEGLNLALEDGA